MSRLLSILAALAASGARAESAAASTVPDTSGLLAQTLFGLLFVIAVILGLAWFAKRVNRWGFHKQRDCQVVATLALGAREKAVLVDIAGHQMLLGVAAGNVRTLHVFDAPVVRLAENAAQHDNRLGASSPAEFSRKLAEFLGQGSKQ